MRIVNPFNLLLFAVIYLVTAHYLRDWPIVRAGRVGWVSDDKKHGVSYDPMDGRMYVATTEMSAIGTPDGSITGWYNTTKVYRRMLHLAVGSYLSATRGEVSDDK